MKIALYGNICNNFYTIVKLIRQYSDIDIHLYLPDNVDKQQLPESDDPHIKGNYPFWIHKSKDWRLKNCFCFWKNNIIKEFSKYDIVILSDLYVSISPFLKAKTIFFVTGSDLTATPFSDVNRGLFNKVSFGFNLKLKLYAFLQRRGIRYINEIWTQPFKPFKKAINKLNIPAEKIKNAYFPLLIDTKLFSSDYNAIKGNNKYINAIKEKFRFVLFHPSRLMIRQNESTVSTGNWKRNDLLFEGFAIFLKEFKIKDAGLVMIDRNVSMEVGRAKEIIRNLGIESNVLWLEPADRSGFSRKELVELYSVADVVADDFGAGWFGSIILEALSVQKPVINYLDEEAMNILYPWHPILSCNTAESIANTLYKLYSDENFKLETGKKSRKWIEEFHSSEKAAEIYIRNLKSFI
jgi:glycosyltransferase involved in cell wall biosynthesis